MNMARAYFFRTRLARWRQAAVKRRRRALVSAAPVMKPKPRAATRYRLAAAPACPAGRISFVRIGEFVISPEGDPRILGHPQIRY